MPVRGIYRQVQESDDIRLLREYVESGSESAFATLVERHINRVYSVALRQTRRPQSAEEITQAVFVILARKAASLKPGVILEGWLYQTARLTATTFIRSEIRRTRREQEAYMHTEPTDMESDTWQRVSPLLDSALAKLTSADRDAVVLRFFYDKSMTDIGIALGASEDTARKRVGRALEKLQKLFANRGVASTTETIALAISTKSIQTAPSFLAGLVTAIAVAKGATVSGSTLSLIKGTLKIMAWTKTKTTIVAGACALLVAGTATVTIHLAGNILRPTLHLHDIPDDWSALSGNRDQWEWTNGAINGHSTNGDSILASTKQYGDVALEASMSTTNREATLAVRFQDADNGYLAVFVPDGTPGAGGIGRVVLLRRVAGQEKELAIFKRRGFSGPGKMEKLTFSAKGSRLEIHLNDVPIIKADDDTFNSGFVGLRVYGDPAMPSDATFSNLTVH